MKTLEIFDVSPYFYTAENVDKFTNRLVGGFPVGGLQYFLKFLSLALKVNNDVVLCFDSRSFRKDLSDDYKSHRKRNYSIYAQIEFLIEHLEKCGIPCYKIDGYEADDLIHTAVMQNYKNYAYLNMHGCDHDLAHNIVDSKVKLCAINSNSNTITEQNFGTALDKGQYILFNTISIYKVLTGDKSDNIKPFVSETGVTGLEVYKELTNFVLENPKANNYLITSNRQLLDLVIRLKYPNFTANDLAFIENNIKLVFPKRANIELKPICKSDINLSKFIELCRMVGALEAQRCFGSFELATPTDREYLAKRGKRFINGEFAVDNDLPITPLDSTGEILFCREFD